MKSWSCQTLPSILAESFSAKFNLLSLVKCCELLQMLRWPHTQSSSTLDSWYQLWVGTLSFSYRASFEDTLTWTMFLPRDPYVSICGSRGANSRTALCFFEQRLIFKCVAHWSTTHANAFLGLLWGYEGTLRRCSCLLLIDSTFYYVLRPKLKCDVCFGYVLCSSEVNYQHLDFRIV